ncbi:MAG: hypothetical protein H0X33_03525 [Taibaiella sp.]|nr:hypothetical protein [Taibaiella sp.]
MKQVLLSVALLFSAFCLNAQSARQQSPPNSGSFYISKTTGTVEEHINVNYALYPAPFVNVVKMNLNTPNDMMLSVKIINSNGTQMTAWKPAQANYRYDKEFDISSYPAGKYRIDIYGPANTKVHSVSFDKKAS